MCAGTLVHVRRWFRYSESQKDANFCVYLPHASHDETLTDLVRVKHLYKKTFPILTFSKL